jgi:hypothetical protein
MTTPASFSTSSPAQGDVAGEIPSSATLPRTPIPDEVDAPVVVRLNLQGSPSQESRAAEPSTSESVSVTVPAMPEPAAPYLRRAETFVTMTKWRGVVLHVGKETFDAMLQPVQNDDAPKKAAVYLEDVPRNERILVTPGAVFYWSIGYHDAPSGSRTRQSVMRFRRFPAWSESEVEEARARAIRDQEAFASE